MEVERNWE